MTADLTKKWGANDCENSIVKYGTYKNMWFKKDRSALVLLHESEPINDERDK